MKGIIGKKITKKFGEETLFRESSFSFPSKGFFLVLGESGSGKSTFFEMLSGIDVLYAGELVVFGRDLKRMEEEKRSSFRLQNIGFLRQSYDLLPHENVIENVLFPSNYKKERKAFSFKALSLLKEVGLSEKRKSLAYTLSGGEKQRLSFARALILDPSILLCDEPTGALDKESALSLLALLKKESKKRLVIISTHDPSFFLKDVDGVYHIENQKILCKKALERSEQEGQSNALKKEKCSFPFLSWVKHSWRLLKSRKYRSVLSAFLLSLSFLGIGLSSYLSRNVTKKMNSAFSSLLGEKMLAMTLKNEKTPTLSDVRSLSLEEIENLQGSLPQTSQVCSSYLSSFEQLFKDGNEIYLKKGVRRFSFSSLSARSVNDFLCLSDYPKNPIFPSFPKTLEVDDVILGLPQNDLVALAKFLQVPWNYDGVGSCLERHNLSLTLEVRNEDWGYFDKQDFFLKGVMEFETPTLFHFDSLWNERIFEERMRLPSSDGTSFETPWTLYKSYGIKYIQEPELFLEEVRTSRFRKYLFERDSKRFDESHNEVEVKRKDNRFFVFSASFYRIEEEDVEKIKKEFGLQKYALFSEGSYRAFPSALSFGFKEPFLLGKDKEEVFRYSEGISKVPIKAIASFPSLSDTMALGSYLRPGSSSLSFSSNVSSLTEGRMPESLDEIVLSKTLSVRLGNPDVVYVAGARESRTEEDFHYRSYAMASLKVVGLCSLSGDFLLSHSHWTSDFFRFKLGVSAFTLEPRECVFYLNPQENGIALSKRLGSLYPKYSFMDPSSLIQSGVDETMGYLTTVLSFASWSLFITSFLLLFVLALLYLVENKKEGKYFYLLGISRESISDGFSAGMFLLLSIGAINALASLFAIEFAFDEVLSESFGVPFSFQIDFYPHLIVILAYIVSLFSVMLFIRYRLGKSDYSKRDVS